MCSSLFFSILTTLLLICYVVSEEGVDRCEPGFADDCFSAVHKELHQIIHSNDTTFPNHSNQYLETFCNAIDDALNCTSDVIDVDCGEDEGKSRFDKWMQAFLTTYYELCDYVGTDDKVVLRAILYQLRCWNVSQFIDCMQTNAHISSIHHLIATDINKNQCNILYKAFDLCRVNQMQTTKDRCTHNQTVSAVQIVHHLFDIFMGSSHCTLYYTNSGISSIHHYFPINLLFIIFLIINFVTFISIL